MVIEDEQRSLHLNEENGKPVKQVPTVRLLGQRGDMSDTRHADGRTLRQAMKGVSTAKVNRGNRSSPHVIKNTAA